MSSSSDSETERAWLGEMASDRPSDESDSSMRKRLVDSLSQSFPGSALSKALHLMEPPAIGLDEVDGDKLSSSCYAEIRLEKGPLEDDELTSLSWLQGSDILKNIANEEEKATTDDGQKENGLETKTVVEVVKPIHPHHVVYNPMKHINSKPPYSFSCLIFMAVEDSPNKRLPVKDIYNWILTHFPYFQNAPTGWKNSVRHNLSLNKCFKKVDKDKGHSIGKGSLWCIDPDYRPNLLQALRKTPYHPYHQLQMMAQTPPNYGHIQRPVPLVPRVNFNTPSPHLFPFLSKRLAQSKLEPDDLDYTDSCHSDSDVANALLSLKGGAFRPTDSHSRSRLLSPLTARNGQYHGARRRSPSPPEYGSPAYRKRKLRTDNVPSPVVYTKSPSEDHTYSVPSKRRRQAVNNNNTTTSREPTDVTRNPLSDIDDVSDQSSYQSSSSDDESDDDDNRDMHERHLETELPVKKRLRNRLIFEDEDAKIAEGANALLNLAGIKTSHIVPMRSISPLNNNNHLMKRQVTV